MVAKEIHYRKVGNFLFLLFRAFWHGQGCGSGVLRSRTLSAPPPDPCLASGMASRVGLGGHQGESVIPDSLFTRTTLCEPDPLHGHQKSYFHLSCTFQVVSCLITGLNGVFAQEFLLRAGYRFRLLSLAQRHAFGVPLFFHVLGACSLRGQMSGFRSNSCMGYATWVLHHRIVPLSATQV